MRYDEAHRQSCRRVARDPFIGVPVFENDIVTRFIGTLMDITEQETARQELRPSQAYREQAEALSHTGSFGWNLSSRELVCSDETFRIVEDDRSQPTLDLLRAPTTRRFEFGPAACLKQSEANFPCPTPARTVRIQWKPPGRSCNFDRHLSDN